MTQERFGIVLGRFQPFHIGHLEYVAAAKARCERLVIGVTNPALAGSLQPSSDPKRSRRESNPFSYFTRSLVIEAALRGDGWTDGSFMIVPADIDDPATFTDFLPEPAQSQVFVTIYDAWGEEKLRRITDRDFAVEILWRRTMSERATSGIEVRDLMRRGGQWQHLVPHGAVPVLTGQLSNDRLAPAGRDGKSHGA
jgi:cytidyltransferase-like protein